MSYPPRPPTWEPPSHPQSSRYEPDTRERLRAVEVWLHHLAQSTAERHGAHVRRLELQERRMTGHQTRLTEAERRTAEIAPISERVTVLETRLRATKERLQYAGAAILIGLVAGGKMTVEQLVSVLQALARLAG